MTDTLTRSWLRVPAFWRVQIAFWSFVLLFGLISRTVLFQNVGKALAFSLLLEPLAFLVSSLLRGIYSRLGITDLGALRTVGWIGLFSVLGALFQAAAASGLREITLWQSPDVGGLQGLLVPFAYYVPIFFGWSLGYFWVRSEVLGRAAEQRATAAEVEALRADLQRLRQQLDPHFLFNALNGVAADIQDEPEAARAMLDALVKYLRYSLDHFEQTVAPLAAEIEALDAYMSVERARFGPQLGFVVTAGAEAKARALPPFLLQPLVENAVKHSRRTGPAHDIVLEVEVEGEWLHLRVQNQGRLPADWQSRGSPGIGLANVRRRLALHYPERHDFTLRQRGDRVSAEISLRGEPCAA